jgi:tryptophanyl-tRNA synthetase
MKKATQQEFPPGWNEKMIRELIAYYDNQTEEEGAAEIEAAFQDPTQTMMSVPTELVPAIAQLIERHQQRRDKARPGRKRAAKS